MSSKRNRARERSVGLSAAGRQGFDDLIMHDVECGIRVSCSSVKPAFRVHQYTCVAQQVAPSVARHLFFFRGRSRQVSSDAHTCSRLEMMCSWKSAPVHTTTCWHTTRVT